MNLLSGFAAEFAGAIRKTLLKARTLPRKVAVFDGDGTLWDADLGEAFLRWLIAGRLLRVVDWSIDVYADYQRRVAADPASGYAWCVQLMANLREDDVNMWAGQLAYAWPNYRSQMRSLVEMLSHEGFEIWVVSASNQWVVRHACRYVGILPERALGIRTEVDSGIITDRLVLPITCNQGKVDSIIANIGEVPLLAFGDSMSDYEMLAYARQGMVVGRRGNENEQILRAAYDRGWPVHLF